MKKNVVFSVLGSIAGSALLMILVSATGVVGAHSADHLSAQEALPLTPFTTSFIYQGQLKHNGTPVNGSCQMAFRLYDDPTAGSVVGSPITATVPFTNGLFSVSLDFGSNAFDGNGRWLDIQLNCTGTFVDLSRQMITPYPYALYTLNSGSASNASLLNGQNASAFVNVTAPQTISGVKTFSGGLKFTDGTTQTTAFSHPPLPGPGSTDSMDYLGNVGMNSSVTIGADGLGLISYYDYSNGDLKVLHCGNTPCNSGNNPIAVDSASNVGDFGTSIAIGADGLGLISYDDSINGNLRVLHCGNAPCTHGNVTTTVDYGGVGDYSSITIGADGLGLIGYYDYSNGDLKVLHCGTTLCNSGNTITTVDNAGSVGSYSSISIGADGLGLISYYDVSNSHLKVLHCGNTLCNSGNTLTTVDNANNVGIYGTSLVIGADGRGLISYFDYTNFHLKVLHCGNATCNSGNVSTTVDSAFFVGEYSSITIGTDGLGLISYHDHNNQALKVLHCGNVNCSSNNTITTLDKGSDLGYFTSVAIGTDGLGLISYYDSLYGDLKVFHCSNRSCTPYMRVGR